MLTSPVFSALAASLIVLLVGDFASTFFYHVPQHAWGKLHLRTHHDRRRSYWDHAVLSRDPQVLLDGFLGAVPYIGLALLCAAISVPDTLTYILLRPKQPAFPELFRRVRDGEFLPSLWSMAFGRVGIVVYALTVADG